MHNQDVHTAMRAIHALRDELHGLSVAVGTHEQKASRAHIIHRQHSLEGDNRARELLRRATEEEVSVGHQHFVQLRDTAIQLMQDGEAEDDVLSNRAAAALAPLQETSQASLNV